MLQWLQKASPEMQCLVTLVWLSMRQNPKIAEGYAEIIKVWGPHL